jgi:MFS family permease
MDNPAIIGLVMGGTGLIAAGASALYGWVARLLDFNGQILLVFTLFFIAAVIIVLASTVGLTEAGLVFTGMASGLIAPSLVTMIIHRVEVRHIATAMGLFTSMIYTSQLLDPFLFQGMKAVLRLSPFTAIMLICAGGIAASLPRAIRTAVR